MDAVQLTQWKHDPEVRDVPEPEPGPGQVLVRVMEGSDGWLECAFLLAEYLEAIDAVE